MSVKVEINGTVVEFDHNPTSSDIDAAAKKIREASPKTGKKTEPEVKPSTSAFMPPPRKDRPLEQDPTYQFLIGMEERFAGPDSHLATPRWSESVRALAESDKGIEPVGLEGFMVWPLPSSIPFLPPKKEIVDAASEWLFPMKDIESGKAGPLKIAGKMALETGLDFTPFDLKTAAGYRVAGKLGKQALKYGKAAEESFFGTAGKMADPELQMIKGAEDAAVSKLASKATKIVPLKTSEPKPIKFRENDIPKDRGDEYYTTNLMKKTGLSPDDATELHEDMKFLREALKSDVVPGRNDEGVRTMTSKWELILKRDAKGNHKWEIKLKSDVSSDQALAEQLASRVVHGDKYPGTINLEKVSSQNAREVIDTVSRMPDVQARVAEQTRGKMSHEITKDLADDLDISPEKLKELNPGTIFNAEWVTAARTLLEQSGQKVMGYAQAIANAVDPVKRGQAIKDFGIALVRHKDIQVAVEGLKAELGRAMEALKVKGLGFKSKADIIKAMMDETSVISEENLSKFAENLVKVEKSGGHIVKNLSKFGNITFRDKLVEAFTAAKLTNPYTYFRNLTGNSLAILSRIMERTAQGPADFLRVHAVNPIRWLRRKPKLTREAFMGEVPQEIYGMYQGIKDGARAALFELQKIYTGEAAASKRLTEVQSTKQAISGIAGRVIRVPYNILSATDMFFREVLGSGSMRAAAYRQASKEGLSGVKLAQRTDELYGAVRTGDEVLLKRIGPDIAKSMREYAQSVADEFTFQRPLGKFAKGANALRQNFMGRMVLPFFRTPVNIGKFVAQRAPGISLLSPRNLHDIFVKGGLEGTEALSRILVGHATGAAMFYYAMDGRITGAPPKNRADRDALERLGWQPYSIVMFDKDGKKVYYSYLGYDPISTQLATAADMADAYMKRMEKLPSETIFKLTTSIGRNITAQPYLQGVTGLLDALNDPEASGGKFVSQTLAGMAVPTGVAAISRGMDTTARYPKGTVESIQARLPGLSEKIRPRRNVWGEPITRDESPFAPFRTKTEKFSGFENHLINIGFRMGFPSQSVLGRKLTPDEYDVLLSATGPRIKLRLEKMISSPDFKKKPISEQNIEIHSVIEIEREKVRQKFIVPSELRALGIDPKTVPVDIEPELRKLIQIDSYKTLTTDSAKKKIINLYLEERLRK